jgi:hypothetical protein
MVNNLPEEISNNLELEDKTSFKDSPMYADAFNSLILAILEDFLLSTDTKVMIFDSMLLKLKKRGYSDIEINHFKGCINEIFNRFNKKSDFMG